MGQRENKGIRNRMDVSLNLLEIRRAKPEDHPKIISVMTQWWGGRDLTGSLPRLFLDHFYVTSFVAENVAEKNGELAGFLVGFLSPGQPDQGYIHFSGIHPDCRKMGLARQLYQRFFSLCQKQGRNVVRACTSPVNTASIAFHTRIGFEIRPGNAEENGVPVTLDYNRPNDPKVLFEIRLPPHGMEDKF